MFLRSLIISSLFLLPLGALAGAQKEEALSVSIASALSQQISDSHVELPDSLRSEFTKWAQNKEVIIRRRELNYLERKDLLESIYYEALRANLSPDLVLALIEVESNFKKYAISTVGARGFMQVMPFWTKALKAPNANLFHLRTNLRFGCTILKHYLDLEKNNLFMALGRYNGSRGKSEYPNLIFAAFNRQKNATLKAASYSTRSSFQY